MSEKKTFMNKNQVSIGGYVQKEVKKIDERDGKPVVAFTICNHRGENRPNFIDVVATTDLELTEGMYVIVDGSLRQTVSEGKEGRKFYSFRINARSLEVKSADEVNEPASEEDHTQETQGEVQEEKRDEPSKPAESNKTQNGNGSEKLTGVISAVNKEGTGIQIDGTWYNTNRKTKVEADLKKGQRVTIYISKGEYNGKPVTYLNAVYNAKEEAA